MNILEIAKKCGVVPSIFGDAQMIEAFAAEITAQKDARIARLESVLQHLVDTNYDAGFQGVEDALANKSNWLELHDAGIRKQTLIDYLQGNCSEEVTVILNEELNRRMANKEAV